MGLSNSMALRQFGGPSDPYFNNVVFLINGRYAYANQYPDDFIYLKDSSRAQRFAATKVYPTASWRMLERETATSYNPLKNLWPMGQNPMLAFNGSTVSYTFANDVDLQLGSGMFTIEFFGTPRIKGGSLNCFIASKGNQTNNTGWSLHFGSTGTNVTFTYGSSTLVANVSGYAGTWPVGGTSTPDPLDMLYVKLGRDATNTLRMSVFLANDYQKGNSFTLLSSATPVVTTYNFNQTDPFYLGVRRDNTTSFYEGLFGGLRITKGVYRDVSTVPPLGLFPEK